MGFGFGVEDLAGLLGGAGEALGDVVEEAGDVFEAGAGRGAGAEDGGALACGVDELGGGPGAGVESTAQRLVHREPEQWRSAF